MLPWVLVVSIAAAAFLHWLAVPKAGTEIGKQLSILCVRRSRLPTDQTCHHDLSLFDILLSALFSRGENVGTDMRTRTSYS